MKISIITVCFNAERTIEKTINSVLCQDYQNIEYIIIDGLSEDNTMNIVNRYSNKISVILSERDMGMYDAINKGIGIATGEIIGILNSDDVFASTFIISELVKEFEMNSHLDSILGDIAFVNNKGNQTRYYSSKNWNPERFVWGYMPAHPSFYCKRKKLIEIGKYRTDLDIASDFELLIRFYKIYNFNYKYLPLLMVNMNLGGKSTKGISSTLKINMEIKIACQSNNLYTNYLMLYCKYFNKILEYRIKIISVY